MDNYEQKYNAALERAKEYHDNGGAPLILEVIFPELKGSEDGKNKRISKEITQFLKQNNGWNREWLAWLEKQGEQKPYGQRKKCSNCQFNYAGECKGFCQMKRDEQEPADNVEPKFKVGDWVVYDHRPYQVVELPKEGYINLGLRRNGKVEFAPSPYCRHWTIADAKDGDVLASELTGSIFLFRGIKDNKIDFYCDYVTELEWPEPEPDDRFGINDTDQHYGSVEESQDIHPATKEQRDLLFAKMKEAGYEWDGEKKELKKIEPKKLDPDKVIEWIDEHVPTKFEDMANYVQQFKEDFGL